MNTIFETLLHRPPLLTPTEECTQTKILLLRNCLRSMQMKWRSCVRKPLRRGGECVSSSLSLCSHVGDRLSTHQDTSGKSTGMAPKDFYACDNLIKVQRIQNHKYPRTWPSRAIPLACDEFRQVHKIWVSIGPTNPWPFQTRSGCRWCLPGWWSSGWVWSCWVTHVGLPDTGRWYCAGHCDSGKADGQRSPCVCSHHHKV